MILPQQQTIRDILEAGATSLCHPGGTELAGTLESACKTPPRLVITDSPGVRQSKARSCRAHVQLTSFSILFARYKGNLRQADARRGS